MTSVPNQSPDFPPSRTARLSFGVLTADERGAHAEPLKPVGEHLADEFERIAARLRRSGLGVG